MGSEDTNEIPKTGNMVLAAFLKNSRRVCSSLSECISLIRNRRLCDGTAVYVSNRYLPRNLIVTIPTARSVTSAIACSCTTTRTTISTSIVTTTAIWITRCVGALTSSLACTFTRTLTSTHARACAILAICSLRLEEASSWCSCLPPKRSVG